VQIGPPAPGRCAGDSQGGRSRHSSSDSRESAGERARAHPGLDVGPSSLRFAHAAPVHYLSALIPLARSTAAPRTPLASRSRPARASTPQHSTAPRWTSITTTTRTRTRPWWWRPRCARARRPRRCRAERAPLTDAPARLQAKAKTAKAAAPLAPSNSNSTQNGKSIEEIYQKKSQLEHILLRPDTYIGSTDKQQQPMWVHNGEKLVFKNVDYVPGLYKIFDEILVNAADNKVRDASMDTVKVEIDPVSGGASEGAAAAGPAGPSCKRGDRSQPRRRAARARLPGSLPAQHCATAVLRRAPTRPPALHRAAAGEEPDQRVEQRRRRARGGAQGGGRVRARAHLRPPADQLQLQRHREEGECGAPACRARRRRAALLARGRGYSLGPSPSASRRQRCA
jgi:hypothetical protein